MAVSPAFRADEWPIATCLHGVPAIGRDGVAFHDAEGEVWDAVFAEIASLGFGYAELADSHIRPADLTASRRDELLAIAAAHGVRIPSVHVQRQSVVDPERGERNLAYAHRTIDALAALGVSVFSTGLHRPFTEAQRAALWFWTAEGPRDPDDPETWGLAVSRLRELGRHCAELGLQMSLELYEDTYLGTADSAVRLVTEIGLENVGLNPDVGNLVRLHRRVEDWREVYAKTLPYANYWHLKNYLRDEAADGRVTAMPISLELGVIDYRRVIREAVEGGYRGILLMEHYGGDSLGVCAGNARYVRSLLPR